MDQLAQFVIDSADFINSNIIASDIDNKPLEWIFNAYVRIGDNALTFVHLPFINQYNKYLKILAKVVGVYNIREDEIEDELWEVLTSKKDLACISKPLEELITLLEINGLNLNQVHTLKKIILFRNGMTVIRITGSFISESEIETRKNFILVSLSKDTLEEIAAHPSKSTTEQPNKEQPNTSNTFTTHFIEDSLIQDLTLDEFTNLYRLERDLFYAGFRTMAEQVTRIIHSAFIDSTKLYRLGRISLNDIPQKADQIFKDEYVSILFKLAISNIAALTSIDPSFYQGKTINGYVDRKVYEFHDYVLQTAAFTESEVSKNIKGSLKDPELIALLEKFDSSVWSLVILRRILDDVTLIQKIINNNPHWAQILQVTHLP